MVTINTSKDTEELLKMAGIGAGIMILAGSFILPGKLLLWALVGAIVGGGYDIYVEKPKRNTNENIKERQQRSQNLKEYGRR